MLLLKQRELEKLEEDLLLLQQKSVSLRPPVRKLLEMLQEWLASLPLDRIPYDAVLDLVNNKMRVRRPLRRGRSVWGPLAAPRHWLLSPVSTTTSRRSLGRDLRQLTEMMGVSTGR